MLLRNLRVTAPGEQRLVNGSRGLVVRFEQASLTYAGWPAETLWPVVRFSSGCVLAPYAFIQ